MQRALTDKRHELVGKDPELVALTKIKACMLQSITRFFLGEDFLWVEPVPALSTLTGACEDFNTVFGVDYFGQQGYLIQTGQVHLEAYIKGPIDRVWAINQSYRKETKMPERRLAAFTLVEAEASGYDLAAIQGVQERLLDKVRTDVLLGCADELLMLGADMARISNWRLPLIRLSYEDAVNTLLAEGADIQFGQDLKAHHEHLLGEMVGAPFFVDHYPHKIKFYNMMRDAHNPELCLSSDLLVPGLGEIAGASQREHDSCKLAAALHEFAHDEKRLGKLDKIGLDSPEQLEQAYKWYVEKESVPHSGFGLGFSRLVTWMCGLPEVWMAMEFPRNFEHLAP